MRDQLSRVLSCATSGPLAHEARADAAAGRRSTGVVPSKLIRVEGGKSSITKVDLDALLTAYGVTSESHRERLQALNRRAKALGWWEDYKDSVSSTYLSYVGYEADAAFIRQFQTGFIPALLQTPEY